MFVSVAAPAQAQTVADLQAQIQMLMAQLASLQTGGTTTTTTGVAFTSNLTVGSTGAEVTALQQMLVARGHLTMPAGVAFGYFGPLTRSALASWQAANGVSPAAGYWGPISRARAAALGHAGTPGTTTGGTTTGGTTTGGSISTPGVEGTLNATLSSEGSGAELSEGDNRTVVMGIELEADQSDIRIERIQINLGSDEDIYRDIADKIYVMDGSTVLASRDLDSSTVFEASDGTLSITLSGMNFIVREGEEEVITIALDALSNIDTQDLSFEGTLTIPVDGIRGVDGAGINQYAPTSAFSETFSVEGVTAGDLDLSEADNNPDTNAVVFIDEDDDTDEVLMLAFELEADNQDITVDAIPVSLTTGVTSATVVGAANRVYLSMNGTVIDSKSIPTTATTSIIVTFNNLDIEIDENDTAEFEVHVDLNDADVTTFASTTTMTASTSPALGGWDVEDALGDDVTVDGGTVSGGVMTFTTAGITVESGSTSATGGNNDSSAWGTYSITFEVTASDEDAYIYNGAASTTHSDTVGVIYDITGSAWAGSGTESAILTSSASISGSHYVVDEGDTETFTLTVTLDPGANGTYALELESIASDDSTAAGGDTTTTIDPNDQSFETSPLFVPAS